MKKRSAFTIVELLISIMIIGILAGLGYGQYTKAIMKANSAALITQFKTIEAAMAKYYSDTGTMPQQLTLLFDKIDPETGAIPTPDKSDLFGFVQSNQQDVMDYWGGPYLERADTTSVNPNTGLSEPLAVNSLNCNGVITPPTTATASSICLKAKLGRQICVGATIDGNNFYNILITNGINGDMVKELFSSANGKGISAAGGQGNALGVADASLPEKLGIGAPGDYTAENGCIVWRFYDSSLRN